MPQRRYFPALVIRYDCISDCALCDLRFKFVLLARGAVDAKLRLARNHTRRTAYGIE